MVAPDEADLEPWVARELGPQDVPEPPQVPQLDRVRVGHGRGQVLVRAVGRELFVEARTQVASQEQQVLVACVSFLKG